MRFLLIALLLLFLGFRCLRTNPSGSPQGLSASPVEIALGLSLNLLLFRLS